MLDFDTIIFDIDGTLIDTSQSYSAVIQETVKRYLELIIDGSAEVEDIISSEDISAFKQFGGFNNDWDTVAGILLYFSNLIIYHGLVNIDQLIACKNIQHFLEQLQDSGLIGIPAVLSEAKLGNDLISYHGDLRTKNIVQRIFQEIYHGSKKFAQNYGTVALFYKGEGYYKRETLLVDKYKLTNLAKNKKIAIATGRIKIEAELVLDTFNLRSVFSQIITDDDVTETQRKPDPAMLYLAAEKTGGDRFVYVGDLPDDMRAGNMAKARLKIASVYVGEHSYKDADYCFKDVNAFIDDIAQLCM